MKLSLGTMVIGDQLDFAASKALLEAWFEAGETEVDTAFLYPAVQHEGRTEALLGEMGLEQLERGVASKANAWTNGGLTGESVVRQLQGSLERLKAKQIDIFYLHMPDPKVPIEETLAAVQKMYEAGAFRRFGLSNYSSWQVMEIHCYMKARNWVLPTAAQYLYNVLSRDIERELVPCLRRLGIALYIYNATCGGFVSGNAASARFSSSVHKERYSARYLNGPFEEGVALLKQACEKSGADPYDAAIRWLVHHSSLRGALGDGIVVGCSSVRSLRANVQSARAGPLPADLVAALDEAAAKTKPVWPSYFR